MRLLAVAIATAALSTAAMAKPMYGAAGCGLGSMVFAQHDNMVTEVLAATTNGTSANQTFGITSGTSNCQLDSGSRSARTAYIEANRTSLENDIARGNGETLNGLCQLYSCKNTTTFGKTLKNNYTTIFSSTNTTTEKVATAIDTVVTKNTL